MNIINRGGGPSSDDDDLKSYVDEDGNLLKRQVNCLNPDFVVCCNTWYLVKAIWPDAKEISELVLKIDKMLVLNFWHPAKRFPDVMNYYTVFGLLQQAL